MIAKKEVRALAALILSACLLETALSAQNAPSPSPRARQPQGSGRARPPVASASPTAEGRPGAEGGQAPAKGGPAAGQRPRQAPQAASANASGDVSGNASANAAALPAALSPARTESRASFITLGGRLAPLRRIDQTATVSGVVTAIHAAPGQWVSQGSPILSVSREVPGETYLPTVVRARIDGRVSDIKPAIGNEVGASSVVASVIDDSGLTLEAFLSDRDAHRVRALDPRQATARAADGLSVVGRLTGISLEPDYSTGLFTARFLFPSAPGARVGMVVFVELPVQETRGVFLPRTLIQRRFGRSMLWILDSGGKLALAEVETGALFGDDICVTKGLKDGVLVLRLLSGKEREGMTREEWEATLQGAGRRGGGGAGMGFGAGGVPR